MLQVQNQILQEKEREKHQLKKEYQIQLESELANTRTQLKV